MEQKGRVVDGVGSNALGEVRWKLGSKRLSHLPDIVQDGAWSRGKAV